MELTINGAPRQFPAALTVAELVEAPGDTGKHIAVEAGRESFIAGRMARKNRPADSPSQAGRLMAPR